MDKEFLTTFEVGQFCQVYHTTVINWVNKGQLKAHVTPGGHRRVKKQDLINFMQTFKIPVPGDLQSGKKKILVVDDDSHIVRLIKKAFVSLEDKIELESLNNGVEALIRIGKGKPQLMILDVVMPEMDGIQVCQNLKSTPDTKGIGIISITGETLSPEQENYLTANVDALFKKPFSVREMVQKSCEILGLEEKAYETKS